MNKRKAPRYLKWLNLSSLSKKIVLLRYDVPLQSSQAKSAGVNHQYMLSFVNDPKGVIHRVNVLLVSIKQLL